MINIVFLDFFLLSPSWQSISTFCPDSMLDPDGAPTSKSVQFPYWIDIDCQYRIGPESILDRFRSSISKFALFYTGSTSIVDIEIVPNPCWIDIDLPYRNYPVSIREPCWKLMLSSACFHVVSITLCQYRQTTWFHCFISVCFFDVVETGSLPYCFGTGRLAGHLCLFYLFFISELKVLPDRFELTCYASATNEQ